MKLKTEVREFESNGVESKSFSVDTSDTMIIKLLRDKMYRNKIGAVCREVASNSRDANREAGKSETPIVISLIKDNSILSEDENSISFQDNGIGISPERMDNIFLKYGSSTKRDSNKYTGGFGIGAKTPFAYSNEFFIETVVERENGKKIKYEYQAVITSDGGSEISRMIPLSETETTESTGTKIVVPIKEKDLREFVKEIHYSTLMWKVKPKFVGFSAEIKLEVIHETEDFLILHDEENFYGGVGTKYIALIDEIPYVISNEYLSKMNTEKLSLKKDKQFIYDCLPDKIKVVLKFKTGEITVSGSREDVEYVEDNLKKFIEKNEKVLIEGETQLLDFLDNVSSYEEACIVSNVINRFVNRYNGGGQGFDRLTNIALKNSTVGKINFIGIVAKHLEYNRQRIYKDYDGKKRYSRINAETFEVFKFSERNGKFQKECSMSYSEIGSVEWSLPIYEMDLAKIVPTRQATLKALYPKGCLIIQHKKDDDIKFVDSLLTYDRGDNFVSAKDFKTGMSNEEKIEIQRNKEIKILIDLEMSISKYSELEKTKNEKDRERNVTDIVKVNARYFDETKWEWASLELSFDKKQKEFFDLSETITKQTGLKGIEKIAFFSVKTLSELKNSSGYWSKNVDCITENENAMRKILLNYKTLIIGVGEARKQNLEDAKIKSISESFIEVVTSKGEDISKALEFNLIKKLNLELPCFSKLNLPKEVKDAKTSLEKEMETLSLKIKNAVFKNNVELLDKINISFIEENKISLRKEIEKNINLFSTFIKKNQSVEFLVRIATKKLSLNFYDLKDKETNDNKIKSLENDIVKLFNSQNLA